MVGDDAGQEDEDGDRQGKKKRKKRANKRQVAKLKEMRKDFLERCVSPEYDRINRVQLNADLKLRNFKNVMAEEQENVRKNRARLRGKGKKGARPGQQQMTGWEHILAAQNV